MKALPSERPEPFKTLLRRAGSDFTVAYDTNVYSVSPSHVGQDVTVGVFAERLEIWQEGKLLTTHVRCMDRHQRFVLPERAEEFQRLTPSRRLLESAFLRLRPTAESFYEGLVAKARATTSSASCAWPSDGERGWLSARWHTRRVSETTARTR